MKFRCASGEQSITYSDRAGFPESHAAASKHPVIRTEKTIGRVKAYAKLRAVIVTKQAASAQGMFRTRARMSAGSPASSHANAAENTRKTEKKSPKALKKSQ